MFCWQCGQDAPGGVCPACGARHDHRSPAISPEGQLLRRIYDTFGMTRVLEKSFFIRCLADVYNKDKSLRAQMRIAVENGAAEMVKAAMCTPINAKIAWDHFTNQLQGMGLADASCIRLAAHLVEMVGVPEQMSKPTIPAASAPAPVPDVWGGDWLTSVSSSIFDEIDPIDEQYNQPDPPPVPSNDWPPSFLDAPPIAPQTQPASPPPADAPPQPVSLPVPPAAPAPQPPISQVAPVGSVSVTSAPSRPQPKPVRIMASLPEVHLCQVDRRGKIDKPQGNGGVLIAREDGIAYHMFSNELGTVPVYDLLVDRKGVDEHKRCSAEPDVLIPIGLVGDVTPKHDLTITLRDGTQFRMVPKRHSPVSKMIINHFIQCVLSKMTR